MKKWLNIQLGRQLSNPTGFFGLVLGKLMNINNKPMYNDAYQLLMFSPGDKVLEIGFGNGAFIQEIIEKINPGNYSGIDISDSMIKAAKRRNRSLFLKGQIDLQKANAGSIPFGNGWFNKVFTINTIYFWGSPKHVMNEIKRVLKPGGIFVVALNTAEAMQNSLYVKKKFTLYKKQEVLDLFSEFGFINIETSYQKLKIEDVFCVKGILPGISKSDAN